MSNIIVGLDIGSSFVRVVIGEITDTNDIEIMGVAKRPSSGLRNGVIINREAVIAVIQETVEIAEQNAGYEVDSCFTGIGGTQIESRNSDGFVAISTRTHTDREITASDVDRVIEASNAVQIDMSREILHVIPQEYIVDNIPGFKDPIGTMAVRLGVEVHIVTASKTVIDTVKKCIYGAGYRLNNMMLKTLASMKATLQDDEKDLGSILIDMGGGTTDVLVVYKDAPICTASIPIGSNLITNDISVIKGISVAAAEKIKIESGCCWMPLVEEGETVIIPGVGGRPPEEASRMEICDIIQARVAEIFQMVLKEVQRKSRVKQLSGSIVLTGGGALLNGVVELAQAVFGTSSVRIGEPGNLGGIEEQYRSPEYATAVGLVLANKDFVEIEDSKKKSRINNNEMKESGSSFFKGVSAVFKKLLETFF